MATIANNVMCNFKFSKKVNLKYSATKKIKQKKKTFKKCEVMDTLISLIGVISQYIRTSKHPIIYLKYIYIYLWYIHLEPEVLMWHDFHPWSWKFHVLRVWPKYILHIIFM